MGGRESDAGLLGFVRYVLDCQLVEVPNTEPVVFELFVENTCVSVVQWHRRATCHRQEQAPFAEAVLVLLDRATSRSPDPVDCGLQELRQGPVAQTDRDPAQRMARGLTR